MEGGEIETMAARAAPEHTAVDVVELAGSMRENLEGFNNRRRGRWSQATIFRVLPCVRKDDNCAYNPQVISIGPFHKDKEDVRAMEELKWQYLHDLLTRRPEADLQEAIAKVSARVEDLRGQYSEEFNDITDSDLVTMMVLDGCFILEYLIKMKKGPMEQLASLPGGRLADPLLQSDFLLLENQIPFFVLEILFKVMAPLPFDFTLTELASSILTGHRLPAEETSIPQFLHLLHLYHYFHVSPCQEEPTACSRWACRRLWKNISYAFFQVYFRLSCLVISPLTCSSSDCCASKTPFPERIRSATKLKEAGVRFKRKEFAEGEPYSMLKVTFSDDGTFEIPSVIIHPDFNSQLRNVVAFEQCCGELQPGVEDYFTSYCLLMSYLIDKESDVDELEENGIIFMFGERPGDAAELFGKVFHGATLVITNHYFSGLLKDVNKFCESPFHRWRARLMRDYFGNPWAIISVLAAAVLLGLTIVQTFYTAYAYYHSR